MGRFLSFLKAIRNNWKKSTFAAAAIAYGVNYAKTSYETKQLMREYCLLAAKYGEVTHQPSTKPLRHVTVILNPAADRRKAKNLFEKYSAPLLHLAGLAVTVVTTERAGQARDILSDLNSETDAIVVAGGDGTLSETVTGLLRRAQDNSQALENLPLGVLPLGRTNSVSGALVGNKDRVRSLADATMSIVDGIVAPVDLIKVEPLSESGKESKPVYGLAKMEWGSFRDARAKRDKYWYFGGLREYVSVLFSKAESGSWKFSYSEPCAGCSACRKSVRSQKRWWHSFVPGKTTPAVDYSKISNPDCGKILEREFSSVELDVETTTVRTDTVRKTEAPHLHVEIGPGELSRFGFVSEGWRRLIKGEKLEPAEEFLVREFRLDYLNEGDSWFSIDSEEFEVKPVKVTILPKMLNLFRPRLVGYVS